MPHQKFVLYTVILIGILAMVDAEQPVTKGDPFALAQATKDTAATKPSESVKDAQGHTYFPDDLGTGADKHLAAMKEPSLLVKTDGGSPMEFRFTWVRAFHDPIAIRIWDSDNEHKIRAVRLKHQHDYSPGPIEYDQTRTMTDQEWADVEWLLDTSNFWKPITPLEDAFMSQGRDGSCWIFENRSWRSYSVLELWTPGEFSGHKSSNKEVRDCTCYVKLGSYLLKISKLMPEDANEFY